MKLKEFRKKMQKPIFSTAEAQVVAFSYDRKLINLQLHQWKKNGDIIRLKRGLFLFSDSSPTPAQIAKSLYWPCYFSLEYVLNLYSIIPEAVFSYTLVTPKKTAQFRTPFGNFIYHSIKKNAFTGFNSETLLAKPEKALIDYLYFNTSRMKTGHLFWKESRLDTSSLSFTKLFQYAKLFSSKKLFHLLTDFQYYAKTYQNHQ